MRKKYPIVMIFFFLLVSCANQGYGPGGGWGHMMYYGYGGHFMWALFLVLIAVIVYLIVQNARSGKRNGQAPMDILKSRYARGEITKEEFERMKKDIDTWHRDIDAACSQVDVLSSREDHG